MKASWRTKRLKLKRSSRRNKRRKNYHRGEKEDVDVDKILNQSGIALAIAALLCAFIGGMRKENRWGIRGALVFGGGTLAFHTLLFGIGIVCSILLIFLIFSFLTGGSLV